ncbi:MAG: ABC transporter ATP-binding protein [Anaerolineae bacterium]|nr:ABC transporter ATP-binding protein [Phycisphaerae bacterium]
MSANGEPLISIDSLRVQFDDLVAVRDVSLKLPASCLVGLIGPNGAGKTTFIRALAGLQAPTRGLVHVLGERVVPGNIAALRHIGFTPDTPPAYDELTVRQFLQMIGKGYQLSTSEADERIDFWLEKVWLTDKAAVKVKQLSRGMRQRLGIARTLLPNPTVILLDEPAAGLDPAGRVQFRQLLMNLRDQGKTLIVSSHILADMSEYCTHIAIMAAGAIVQFGTVAQVAGNGAIEGRCRYTIVLASPVAGIDRMLASIEGVADVQVDSGDRIMLEYFIERDRAAALLRELIARQIPVASFAINTQGLEEAYLRTGIRQVD